MKVLIVSFPNLCWFEQRKSRPLQFFFCVATAWITMKFEYPLVKLVYLQHGLLCVLRGAFVVFQRIVFAFCFFLIIWSTNSTDVIQRYPSLRLVSVFAPCLSFPLLSGTAIYDEVTMAPARPSINVSRPR